jgi:thiamine-phosphate pyrophosphorylase
MIARRPIVCLVTDRRRLCEGCDEDAARRCLASQVQAAVDAGVDLVQIRERDLDSRRLFAIVTDAVALTRGTATQIVVNDRLDVALAADADGVHLRGDSFPADAVRRIGRPGFLVGRSVHSAREAAANAANVDYFVAGTVFPSASKEELPSLLGEAGLSAVVAAAAPVPVIAIGGVTAGSIARIAAADAAGFAAIGAFLGAPRPCRSANLRDFVKNARARFDSVRSAP